MNDYTKTVIEDRRAALLNKLKNIRACKAGLAEQERSVLRDLADCDAAGRIFGIEFADAHVSRFPLGTIRDLAQAMLRDSASTGMKASDLRRAAETKFNREFHYKSAGVALYRLANEGKARRDGRLWFPVGSQIDASLKTAK